MKVLEMQAIGTERKSKEESLTA